MGEQTEDKQTKRKNWFRRHKIITGLLIFFAISLIVHAANNPDRPTQNVVNTAAASPSSTNAPSPAPTPVLDTPKLNQEARDGKFAFTVTNFTCGSKEVADPNDSYIVSDAHGQFCIMNLDIKNIGTVAQDFEPSNMYLYDSDSKQYSYSSDATITVNLNNSEFSSLQTVNPGVSISGNVIFDVPKSVTPSYAILHDSAGSNGVKIVLK